MESATHEIERRGIGRMFTASGSIYELGFEGGTLCRVSVESPVPAPGQPISLPLRRDGEVLRVLEIVQLRLYRRAIFVLEPLEPLEPLGPPPSVFTRRSTTPVVAFEPVDAPKLGR